MEATLSDHQMLELDESQEGLKVVSRCKRGGVVGEYEQVFRALRGWGRRSLSSQVVLAR